jgi:hypothetical protein
MGATSEMIAAAGGIVIAARVDHTVEGDIKVLAAEPPSFHKPILTLKAGNG